MREIIKLLFKNVRYFELESKMLEIKCINVKNFGMYCHARMHSLIHDGQLQPCQSCF